MIARVLGSSLGKKYVMALTGAALVGFLFIHMFGNWQLFAGRERLNHYAATLKAMPPLLWGARVGLLALIGLHLWAAISLTLAGRAAKPVRYQVSNPNAASYASRTMIWSGLIVLSFVIYHLLQFTLGVTDPALYALRETLPDGLQRHDVYGMVVAGFQNPWVSGFYILAMGLLCLHLAHGVSALVQSLGWRSSGNRTAVDRLARLIAAVLFAGNAAMPLAVLLGLVPGAGR